ncbi:MAG: nitrous oxide reductase family maturation protein NosD [Promethearchaeota archaeon]
MGQDVKDCSRVCPLPPGPLRNLNRHLRHRTRFIAVGLSFILTTAGLVYYLMQSHPMILEPWEKRNYVLGAPHAAIAIDGDANFNDTALLEGWPGDGSPEDPYILDGLEIDLGNETGNCIEIRNTRVSFIISSCNLTDAGGHPTLTTFYGCGIVLDNVTNGELVNNTCNNNWGGIILFGGNTCNNMVVNNTCNNNRLGMYLRITDSNTVANNTCNNNGDGIWLSEAYAIVANNTCDNNDVGIFLDGSDSNTVTNNTCFSNRESGIQLYESNSNTVENNICNSNRIGIYLYYSESNAVANNTFSGNTERDILVEYETEESETEGSETERFDPLPLLFSVGYMGIIAIILLVVGRIMVKFSRVVSNRGES